MKLSIVLSLCGSLALGGAALLVAKVWLPSGSQKVEAAALPQANLVSVVVATSPLPYGTRLEAGKLALRQYPSDAVPEGAFTTIDQVMTTDNGGPPLVLTAMAARETVLPAKISGPGARASVAVQITEGMRGYAIAVTDATGVGGNALPGDWVDVIMTRETNSDASDKGMISQVVVQNVRVLGVDLNADPASTQTAVRRTATLEVKPDDAQKLALATQLGELSMSLRKTGSVEIAAARSMRAGDVSNGGTRIASAGPVRRVASRLAGPPMPPPPPPVFTAPTARSITIVNGGTPSRVSVPVDKSGAAG